MSDRNLPVPIKDAPRNMLRVRVGRVVEVRITGWGLLAAAFIAMFPVGAGIWARHQYRLAALKTKAAAAPEAPESGEAEAPGDTERAANRA